MTSCGLPMVRPVRREPCARARTRDAQQRARHRRQRVDRRAAVALDQVERPARLEAALQHQRGAVRQGGRQRVDARRRTRTAAAPTSTRSPAYEPLPLADVEPVLDHARNARAARPSAGCSSRRCRGSARGSAALAPSPGASACQRLAVDEAGIGQLARPPAGCRPARRTRAGRAGVRAQGGNVSEKS